MLLLGCVHHTFIKRGDEAAAGDCIAFDTIYTHVIEHIDGQRPLATLGQRRDDGAVCDGITLETPLLHIVEHLQGLDRCVTGRMGRHKEGTDRIHASRDIM